MRKLRFLATGSAIGVLAIAIALTPTACGSILGITDGTLFDASEENSSAGNDVTTGDPSETGGGTDAPDAGDTPDADATADASHGDTGTDVVDGGTDALDDGAAEAGDGSDASDAAPLDAGDGCVDPNYCTNHCTPGTDSCGEQRACIDNCASNLTCDMTSGQCTCQHDPNWCNGRCNTFPDNCGNMFDCMMCAGGLSCNSSFTCGCVPQANPCGSRQCGQALDSCGHPVTCGNNGLCQSSGDVCNADAGTCCTPNPNPCNARCGNVQVDNGCGQMVGCPAGCPSGYVCDQTTCCTAPQCGNSCNTTAYDGCGITAISCTCPQSQVCYNQQCCIPNGTCGTNCLDNCGQPCCADSGPPDSGMCVPGGPCPGGQGCCPGLACTTAQTCAPSCVPLGGMCASLASCCYGATSCTGGVLPDGGVGPMAPASSSGSSGSGSSSGVIMPPTCQ